MNNTSETLEVQFTPKDPYRESYLSSGLLLQPAVSNYMEFDNACFLIIDHSISNATIKLKLVSCPFKPSKLPQQNFSFKSLTKEQLEELSGDYAVTGVLTPGNNDVLKAKQEEIMEMEKEYTINLNFLKMEVLEN